MQILINITKIGTDAYIEEILALSSIYIIFLYLSYGIIRSRELRDRSPLSSIEVNEKSLQYAAF
jgi:hypothetical protein